jgi:hypothetical protein
MTAAELLLLLAYCEIPYQLRLLKLFIHYRIQPVM